MTSNYDIAEQIYMDVYSETAENANYLQPSSGIDFLLPEVILTALTSTILVAFLQGFFQEVGQNTAGWAKRKVFNRSKSPDEDVEVHIKELASKLEQIQDDPEKLQRAQRQIEAAFLDLEVSPKESRRMASKMVEIIMHKKRQW